MHPQDFVKANHCLLKMADFSLLFFGKIVNLITVEPDELSGIIEMDIHIVLCSKHPQAKKKSCLRRLYAPFLL